jgi:hypothetical protein
MSGSGRHCAGVLLLEHGPVRFDLTNSGHTHHVRFDPIYIPVPAVFPLSFLFFWSIVCDGTLKGLACAIGWLGRC